MDLRIDYYCELFMFLGDTNRSFLLVTMVEELYCCAFLGFRFFYSKWLLVIRERSEQCLLES